MEERSRNKKVQTQRHGKNNRHLKKVEGRTETKNKSKKNRNIRNISLNENYQSATSRFEYEVTEDGKIMIPQNLTAKYVFVFSLLL